MDDKLDQSRAHCVVYTCGKLSTSACPSGASESAVTLASCLLAYGWMKIYVAKKLLISEQV